MRKLNSSWVLLLFLVFTNLVGSSGCSLFSQPKSIEVDNIQGPQQAYLRPGDSLDISIFSEGNLSGERRISTLGMVKLPLVGRLEVAGLTIEQAALKVKDAYESKYLKNAEVTVKVTKFNSRKIFVLGEVGSPGPIDYEDNMTLINAIAQAGGTSSMAAANRTIVTRENAGKQERFTAKVGEIGRGESPDLRLMPGDIVFVPESIF